MDKYYFPAIDEFYNGFECEISESYLDEGLKPNENWTKIKFNIFNPALIEERYFRVKYLDSDDIKSLIPRNFIILQSNTNPVDVEIYINKNTIENRHYSGTIKNKSELNRIIKNLTNG